MNAKKVGWVGAGAAMALLVAGYLYTTLFPYHHEGIYEKNGVYLYLVWREHESQPAAKIQWFLVSNGWDKVNPDRAIVTPDPPSELRIDVMEDRYGMFILYANKGTLEYSRPSIGGVLGDIRQFEEVGYKKASSQTKLWREERR